MERVAADKAQADNSRWWHDRRFGATAGSGVSVAVVDSGWRRAEVDERVLAGVGFVDDSGFVPRLSDDDDDRIGHGTACALVILRMARKATIRPVRIFGNTLEASPDQLVAAITWSIDMKVNIINLSLSTPRLDAVPALYKVCEAARASGVVVVAAGNNAGGRSFPAEFDNVIGVAAGRFMSPLDFRFTPDADLECTAKGSSGRGAPGRQLATSHAAATMSGIIALVLSVYPRLTLEEVRDYLCRSAI